MKNLLCLLLVIISFKAYCQSKEDLAFSKVKNYFITSSVALKKEIFYNKFNHTLVIDDDEIAILNVKVIYKEYPYNEDTKTIHYVSFNVPAGSPPRDPAAVA